MAPPRPRKVSFRSRTVLRDQIGERAYHIISPDALALVRFGLRAPDDPRILNTLRAIDALLAVRIAARSLLVSL